MNLSQYIGLSNEEDILIEEAEAAGFRVFDVGDGTYYPVTPRAPKEADFLASSAAQGDPRAIDEILGLDKDTSEDDTAIAEALKSKRKNK